MCSSRRRGRPRRARGPSRPPRDRPSDRARPVLVDLAEGHGLGERGDGHAARMSQEPRAEHEQRQQHGGDEDHDDSRAATSRLDFDRVAEHGEEEAERHEPDERCDGGVESRKPTGARAAASMSHRPRLQGRMSTEPASVARGRRRPALRRLPARRVDRAGVLPGRQAGQARARRGPGRRRQDRAGQGALALPRRARWSASSATRASTRPRPCTSGTTASSSCASRPRPARRAGRRSRTTSSARSSCSPARSCSAIASPEPVGAADRRDRQDRPGVRGDAARAALGLPDHHPRARPHRGPDACRSSCSPRTTRAS